MIMYPRVVEAAVISMSVHCGVFVQALIIYFIVASYYDGCFNHSETMEL